MSSTPSDFAGPFCLLDQHNGIYIWVPNSSSPLVLFEGTQTSPPLSPLSMTIWVQQRQNIFLSFFSPCLVPWRKEQRMSRPQTSFWTQRGNFLQLSLLIKRWHMVPASIYKNQDVQRSQSWIAWAFQGYKLLKKNKHTPSIWSITYSGTVSLFNTRSCC